eukprot:m.361582 g.361582  ORF g.361582 m.361582 type:complete len:760 (+) comp19698_c0_seq1:87-2366(+)
MTHVLAREFAPTPVDAKSAVAIGVSAAFLRQFVDSLGDDCGESTTKDICDRIVVARTSKRGLSYIEQCMEDESSQGGKGSVEEAGEWFGPATVFISHAWKYRFADVVSAMLEYGEAHDKTYFWFDLFINNQNVVTSYSYNWWTTTFKSSIASIGRVLVVMQPWSDPIPLTRAWCLWEMYCAISQQVDLSILIPKSEATGFRNGVLGNFRAVLDVMTHVNAEKAEAWNLSDRDMIFNAIKQDVGFDHLNALVKGHMRKWLLDTSEGFIDAFESQDGSGKESMELARLCLQVGSIHQMFNNKETADKHLNTTIALCDKLGQSQHRYKSIALSNLGLLEQHAGNLDKAIELYRQALSISGTSATEAGEAGDEEGSQGFAQRSARNNLASALLAKGELPEALEMFQAATADLSKLVQANQHSTELLADSYVGAALVYVRMGDGETKGDCLDNALQAMNMALKTIQDGITDSHNSPAMADVYTNLATLLTKYPLLQEKTASQQSVGLEQDKDVVAFAPLPTPAHMLELAIGIYSQTKGEQHPDTIRARANLAKVLANQGRSGSPDSMKFKEEFSCDSESEPATDFDSDSDSDNGSGGKAGARKKLRNVPMPRHLGRVASVVMPIGNLEPPTAVSSLRRTPDFAPPMRASSMCDPDSGASEFKMPELVSSSCSSIHSSKDELEPVPLGRNASIVMDVREVMKNLQRASSVELLDAAEIPQLPQSPQADPSPTTPASTAASPHSPQTSTATSSTSQHRSIFSCCFP